MDTPCRISSPCVNGWNKQQERGSRKSSSSREHGGQQRPDVLHSVCTVKKYIRRNRIFAFKEFLMCDADNGRERCQPITNTARV